PRAGQPRDIAGTGRAVVRRAARDGAGARRLSRRSREGAMPAFDGLIGEDFAAARGRPRDMSRPIMLIGYQDEENLGLGYLSATLRRFGYRVLVYNFNAKREEIVAAARRERPLVIGLSLIFQFYLPRFAELVRTLRDGGVNCHLTIGGHFPSLSWQPTLEMIPELDSVVRFEGEVTLLELADALSTG